MAYSPTETAPRVDPQPMQVTPLPKKITADDVMSFGAVVPGLVISTVDASGSYRDGTIWAKTSAGNVVALWIRSAGVWVPVTI